MSDNIFDAIDDRNLAEVERILAEDSSVVESKKRKKTPLAYTINELEDLDEQLTEAKEKNPPNPRQIITIERETASLTAIQTAINTTTLRYRGEATTNESSPDGSPTTMQGDKLRLFQARYEALQAAENEYLDTLIDIDRKACEELDELVRDIAGMTNT
ncbi:MAG: hypothetical protein K0U37_00610 [Gammaproteobacteria bacterium]|nr:hypothetical protein [Gammaproteobacteria bacterium]